MAAPQPPTRETLAAGALAPAPARWETLDQSLRLPVRGLESRRGVVRGPPVEVPASEPFSLWGKFFDAVTLILLFLCIFSYNGLPYTHFSFLRLKQTLEQARLQWRKGSRWGRPPRIQVSSLFPWLWDLCCSYADHHDD